MLHIIKGEGEHIILDGNKRIDLDSKHENATWEAVEMVMENSLLTMQKNYGIDGLPKTLTYQDGWLRAAIETTIIDTQVNHSVKSFSRHWQENTQLGQLLKTIFKGAMGGRGSDKAIAEIFGIDMNIGQIKEAWNKGKKFNIQGGTKEDRAMLRDLLEIIKHMPGAETTAPGPTPIDAKIISSITKADLIKLKNLSARRYSYT